ncbi:MULTISPECIES: DUF4349 domain-containing protein [Chitinophagaceae]
MKKLIIPAMIFIGFLYSCDQQSHSSYAVVADSTASYEESKAATATNTESQISLDSSRQYLQTAYIKMQVKKLQETKQRIRQIVSLQKGFILSSELENNVADEKTIVRDQDSAISIRQVSTTNTYSLKIPAQNLDSTIFLLEQIGVRIDNSSQKAEDISLQWTQNSSLYNDSTIEDLKSVKATNNAGIKKVMTMHELRQQQRSAKLENQELAYNIRYADLKLDIYEAPILQTLIIPNTDQYQHYKTPFGYQFRQALSGGVDLFQTIVVAIAHLWLVLLTVAVFIFLWKAYRRKKQTAKIAAQ